MLAPLDALNHEFHRLSAGSSSHERARQKRTVLLAAGAANASTRRPQASSLGPSRS